MKKSIFTILSITILILAWQLLTMLVRLPDLVPSIPHLFSTLVALFASGSFYQSVMATVLRGTIGMSISLMAAMGVSLLFYKCEWIYELFRPLLAIMRSIPVISFILLALIFLNAESIPLIIAFLTMFPLLTENLTKGIRGQRNLGSDAGTSWHRWSIRNWSHSYTAVLHLLRALVGVLSLWERYWRNVRPV